MTLAVGSRLGPYEILGPIGAGGMGEVYRARDTRLDRAVAIKVLPAQLSSSPELRERLEREARTISQLSHPHICALYDIGREGDTDFFVMEYLEGQTLAERLEKGSLPFEQVCRYGGEIAEALGTAHAAGVVHRDLKPGNVMLTKSGVKLMDFGLAKVHAAPVPIGALTSAPTRTRDLTIEGTLLGTVPYMAPEQLEGRQADARTDIFAFGAVLHEMAVGRKAFTGASQASLMAAILTSEPPAVSSVQAMSPPAFDRLVQTCLAKDPADRWQSAQDIGLQLAWIARGGTDQPGRPARNLSSAPRWLMGLAAASVLTAAALMTLYALRRPPSAPAAPIRFAVRAPVGTRFTWTPQHQLFAVSPDGRRLVFVARGADGRDFLWMRSLSEPSAVTLPGTDGALAPFWSPDGRFIAFFADGKLKKIDSSGGPPVALCDARGDYPSGSWGSQHSILFAPLSEPFIRLVADGGGSPSVVLKADASRGERTVCWPSFLPDGRHYLYLGRNATEKQTYLRLGSIEGGKTAPLLTNCSRAQYVPGDSNNASGGRSGYLLYARDGNLLAQPFDSRRLRLAGDPIPSGQEIWQHVLIGIATFSASNNGLLASRGGRIPARLVWIDRAGRETGSVAPTSGFESVRLSPDSRKFVVSRTNPRTGLKDLLIGDLSRGVLARLDLDSDNDYAQPVWSPDGTRIALSVRSMRDPRVLHWLALRGSGFPQPILPPGGAQRPEDWSPDGRFILYFGARGSGLWVVNVEGEPKPRKLVSETTADPTAYAQFSPDGHWIAYCSPESGRSEVYLTSFPEPTERIRVSASGGSRPRWKRDGREIYFVSADNEMIATPVRLAAGVEIGEARPLFRIDPAGWSDYDVTPDGARFLAAANIPIQDADAIAVTVNWLSLLPR
jgi:Tol biopolymer transport system component